MNPEISFKVCLIILSLSLIEKSLSIRSEGSKTVIFILYRFIKNLIKSIFQLAKSIRGELRYPTRIMNSSQCVNQLN